MSKYGERHRTAPPCAVPQCPHPGAKLRMVDDKPIWLCVEHDNEVIENPTPPWMKEA